jgi:phosphoesterase RecJ-like protein
VVFFKQVEEGVYRVSMRSKGGIDVGAVAKQLGGGGHRNAAGCTATGAIDALLRLFVGMIQRAIDDHDARVASPGGGALPELSATSGSS